MVNFSPQSDYIWQIVDKANESSKHIPTMVLAYIFEISVCAKTYTQNSLLVVGIIARGLSKEQLFKPAFALV